MKLLHDVLAGLLALDLLGPSQVVPIPQLELLDARRREQDPPLLTITITIITIIIITISIDVVVAGVCAQKATSSSRSSSSSSLLLLLVLLHIAIVLEPLLVLPGVDEGPQRDRASGQGQRLAEPFPFRVSKEGSISTVVEFIDEGDEQSLVELEGAGELLHELPHAVDEHQEDGSLHASGTDVATPSAKLMPKADPFLCV